MCNQFIRIEVFFTKTTFTILSSIQHSMLLFETAGERLNDYPSTLLKLTNDVN